MKKLLCSIAIMLMVAPVFVITGCGTSDRIETLTVNFVQQPKGGQNVQTLSCTYTATYFPPASYKITGTEEAPPVKLKVSWMNDKGGQYEAEGRTFDQGNAGGTYTVTKTTGAPNLFFDKTFWLRCSWSDKNGSYTVESGKAVCTVR